MLKEYAWFGANSNRRTWPVGMLKPNTFGLFDVYGNVKKMAIPTGGGPVALNGPETVILCGAGSFELFRDTHSTFRSKQFSNYGGFNCGLRVAQSLPSD
jgi:hypothetical protein